MIRLSGAELKWIKMSDAKLTCKGLSGYELICMELSGTELTCIYMYHFSGKEFGRRQVDGGSVTLWAMFTNCKLHPVLTRRLLTCI